MSQNHLPQFQKAFLHPKHWGFWLGLGIYWLILCLPYPILVKMGRGLGWLFGRLGVGKRRAAIARRNLELAFPERPEQWREKVLQANMQNVGMALLETGMAWFWSDKRIKKWSKIEGLEHLKDNAKDGIILVGVHFLTLELGARIIGLYHPGVGVYRPNDKPLMDWLQTWGRLRSNKHMLNRKDLRGMLKALRQGETIWYAPDHDYGRKSAVFIPFFAVQDAATTTGSYYLLKASPKSKVIPFAPLRNKDNSGYTIIISSPVDFTDVTTERDVAIRMNSIVETEILKGVDQYMWLHRRFKTEQDGDDGKKYR
ncbi:LpxL/LpxP family Kdo(2)-lipid IV(A) lauroyl/palmitoleoyl acyltransferasee [Lonepinella koalarum]|uniref:Lipid A biosynthesis acyltransferase n=1 Tax=Lonepinella koalarum TaxID=53417 RepID=A0A4R1L0S5_9PAST|nr:Kdo(2)-lipid IV(A) acyltransferase [Lonepinella koalarum]MDH2926908.1 lipid A biosynthesis lauroyl acyltransferase [Lonepinella koalarum]TCK70433.1 KDO2-lipid IV(A) lauroyltransferase [Lonepinella koalarum]TFJ90178.1 LpxL/LpxP family Kdo(2)-lipid IV(A) lauroyl/palmitoleoyl acyltransferase [Lonepinella koalarum]TYG33711.1 LpxL/LpxP family Kdo(2)-lipid IV(A) lauroyl/palmitoleoyl acyltransferasee [Lonepinella koalarum]